jgi:hypothetical protein
MGFQFANGVNAEGVPVCIFLRHDQISLNYCEWVEIARAMGWKLPDEELQVLEEIPMVI